MNFIVVLTIEERGGNSFDLAVVTECGLGSIVVYPDVVRWTRLL
jgi:hypothetical protein